MRLLIILLIIPLVTKGQLSISGQVTLCGDFKKTISIPGKLSYSYKKDKKNRVLNKSIDTLQATIYVYKLDSLLRTEKTNHKGQFNLTLVEKDIYRLKFQLMNRVYKDTVINLQSTVDKIKICLSDSGLHNYFLRQIPYDSVKAKNDISNDTIRIISLISKSFSGCRLNLLDYLSDEEKGTIEKKYGFTYEYFVFDKTSQNYLDQRQREYNDIVYKYLDRKFSMSSKRLIDKEILNLAYRKKSKEN